MAEDHQQRLSLAVRRNRGGSMVAALRKSTAPALGKRPEELNLVDLPTSDSALTKVLSGREAVQSQTAWVATSLVMRARSRCTIASGLDALGRQFMSETMLLHRAASEYCGAIELNAHELIDRAFELVELDQESVIAGTEDGAMGLILEMVSEPMGADAPLFKLVGWAGLHIKV